MHACEREFCHKFLTCRLLRCNAFSRGVPLVHWSLIPFPVWSIALKGVRTPLPDTILAVIDDPTSSVHLNK